MLPTSSSQQTFAHGNYGSALVTTKSVRDGLSRQDNDGKITPLEYRASTVYGVGQALTEKVVGVEMDAAFVAKCRKELHEQGKIDRIVQDANILLRWKARPRTD